MNNPQSIKQALLNICTKQVEEKLDILQSTNNIATEGLTDDSKSTAGDKHETGRAMMHLEQEKNAPHINVLLLQQKTLSQINPNKKQNIVEFGSLVQTTIGFFFIATSSGKLNYNNEVYFAVSINTPIGKIMHKKKKGDSFIFNNQDITITNIY